MRVLGLGNALVDILARISDDSMLKELNLPKGSMQLVDQQNADNVSQAIKDLPKSQASGGSAANTIHGLANLGIQTGFIGKVGTDDLGTIFKHDMEQFNILPHLFYSHINKSGHCTSLISADSERTLATYLGAAVELNAGDLSENLFDDYHYFHVEGYLIQNPELIECALKIAKQKGLKISLDLASYNVVEANLATITRLVEEYVDILFANEEEAKSFSGKEGREALDYMGQKVDIAVLKLGKKGSLIKHFDEVIQVGVIPVNSIDTTGAGDLYAAGFLYGLINRLTPRLCGEAGAILSGNVIEVIGPKMDQQRWTQVRSAIASLKN